VDGAHLACFEAPGEVMRFELEPNQTGCVCPIKSSGPSMQLRAIAVVAALSATAPVHAQAGPAAARTFFGTAAYYSGRGAGLTAAHKTLPFGTRVRVTNIKTGRSVVVTINDRGPFNRGRVLDLCTRAARALGMMEQGVARVRADVL
jgi:rare lipoprotein A